MNQNRFWDLLAKRQSGEATPGEQTELNEYITKNGIDKNMLEKLGAFWDLPVQFGQSHSQQEIGAKWNKLQSKILAVPKNNNKLEHNGNAIGKRRMLYYKLAIAASIIAVIVIATDLWTKDSKADKNLLSENIVSTKNGSKSKLQLPDGTVVWLNAGSKILYNEAYNKKERAVELIGEAFFDVVHNAEKPFIIHTKAMDVKVLGTVFNVRAYPNDKITEASLIKGSIEVTFTDGTTKKVILKPNEKITVLNTKEAKIETNGASAIAEDTYENISSEELPEEVAVSGLTYQPSDSSIIETAWVMQNKLIFKSKSFNELSKEMERWFNVTIRFADKNIMKIKFTGSFFSETITEALSALQLSYNFKYRFDKTNKLITVYNK